MFEFQKKLIFVRDMILVPPLVKTNVDLELVNNEIE
jgi:hypothetical protein